MLVAGVLALEQKVLVVQDYLAVHVLNQNPESFGATVDLVVPLEVKGDGQLDLKRAPATAQEQSVIIHV